MENDNYKLYWDHSLLTDKSVHLNRPGITLFDKANKDVHSLTYPLH